MDAARHREIESLFIACRACPASEWDACFDAADADAEMRAEVLSLLHVDAHVDNFLDTNPKIGTIAPLSDMESLNTIDPSADRVGPFEKRTPASALGRCIIDKNA